MWPQIAVTAGAVATALFVLSTLPMLTKAARTKDLSSYSGGNLIIANAGNAFQVLYVLTLPPGPVWALHALTPQPAPSCSSGGCGIENGPRPRRRHSSTRHSFHFADGPRPIPAEP